MKSLQLELRAYFKNARPLGRAAELISLRSLGGGNHDNVLCRTNRGFVVARVVNPNGIEAGKLDVRREFLLLKLLEKHRVGPKAIKLETRRLSRPMLIEEFIDGESYKDLPRLGPEHLHAACDLMTAIARMRVVKGLFPSLESKTRYEVDMEKWRVRLDELQSLGGKHLRGIAEKFKPLVAEAGALLTKNRDLLASTKKCFIYNDIHGANLLWIPAQRRAMLVDWQKVSWGDPAFMPAVFALAFEGNVSMATKKFHEWLVTHFSQILKIKSFDRLFHLRILEREVSNMLWVPWAALKKGEKIPFSSLKGYSRYGRVIAALKRMRSLRF